MGLRSITNDLNILYNGSELFYYVNVPANIFSNGIIDLELEVPNATSLLNLCKLVSACPRQVLACPRQGLSLNQTQITRKEHSISVPKFQISLF